MLTLKTTSLFSKTCSRCVSTSVVRSGVVSTSRRQNATPTSVQLNLLRAQPHSNRQHHHHTAAIAAAASAPGDQAAMAATTTAPVTPEQRQQIISDSIRGIPDFPKPGILFWDVTTLLLDPRAFQLTVDALYDRYKDQKIDAVAGFEARGLIFGAPLALALGCAFVPLRKPGKLPGETISEEYITEYSTDKIEMHTGAVQQGQRVLLVDDLIATGGTLKAGINLMKKVGAEVVEAACVIELPALKGREKLEGLPLFVLIEKEGE